MSIAFLWSNKLVTRTKREIRLVWYDLFSIKQLVTAAKECIPFLNAPKLTV